jgi:hypothetical protein
VGDARKEEGRLDLGVLDCQNRRGQEGKALGREIVYIYCKRSSQGRMKNKHNGDSVLCDCSQRQERLLSEVDMGSIDSTMYDLCAA